MPEVDTIVIIGNGPSMKSVNLNWFDGVHTFGMKNAYRFYSRVHWWPTYFGNFDVMSLQKNVKDYQRIVMDPNVPVQKFFMAVPVCNSPRLKLLRMRGELYEFGNTWETFGNGRNTAVNCAQAAVCMGYKRMLLIGIDCRWKHAPNAMGPYTVEDPSLDKDYFFDGYRRRGEVCNAPKPGIFHIPAWEKFGEFASECGVEVVNCSSVSTLECFPKSTLERELPVTG